MGKGYGELHTIIMNNSASEFYIKNKNFPICFSHHRPVWMLASLNTLQIVFFPPALL